MFIGADQRRSEGTMNGLVVAHPRARKLGLRSYDVASRGRTLWADERQRELERKNQSGPEWARVSQSEPERARESQSESKWARVTVTEWVRESRSEPDWARKLKCSSFCRKKCPVRSASQIMKTLRSEPTQQLLYPALAKLICLNQQIGFYNVLVSAINIDI